MDLSPHQRVLRLALPVVAFAGLMAADVPTSCAPASASASPIHQQRPALGAPAPMAVAAPAPDFGGVPERTSLSYTSVSTGVHVGTANENEPRPGLSTVKLYMADHILRRGDATPDDIALTARMIQVSDDSAAVQLDGKYPEAIDAVASEYGLGSTSRNGYWGDSVTSTADTVSFLVAKKRTDPGSPILGWMATASPTAADGFAQDFGTARLPAVSGSKWGWADDRSSVVASASVGDDFVVASNTLGPASVNTDDVLAAFGPFDLAAPPAPQTPTPSILDFVLGTN